MQVRERYTVLCKQVFSYRSFAILTQELLERIVSRSVFCGHGTSYYHELSKMFSAPQLERLRIGNKVWVSGCERHRATTQIARMIGWSSQTLSAQEDEHLANSISHRVALRTKENISTLELCIKIRQTDKPIVSNKGISVDHTRWSNCQHYQTIS